MTIRGTMAAFIIVAILGIVAMGLAGWQAGNTGNEIGYCETVGILDNVCGR